MDRKIVRDLAAKYFREANSDENRSKVALHKGVNDLKMIRPIVLVNELPLHEFNTEGELTLYCEDPLMREVEHFFRVQLYRKKHFNDDNHMYTYYPIMKQGSLAHMSGISIEEDRIESGGHVAAHMYKDVLSTEEELEKIYWKPGHYDRDSTMKRYELVADAIGDILPVKIQGYQMGMGLAVWDDVAQWRGAENLLKDLADRPEFMHQIARKLTDGYIKTIDDGIKNGMYAVEFPDMHCTANYTNDLKPVTDFDNIQPVNLWGRGVAQIFGFVSPQMHDEFDIQYQLEALKPFGLVYYGCCERLDNKIHLLEKMHNLRKISITPWADINAAAEKIGRKYVMSVKPNPANVGAGFNEENVRLELKPIIEAAKRNDCSFELVLKDISTVDNKPQNLTKWTEIAMEMVNDYA